MASAHMEFNEAVCYSREGLIVLGNRKEGHLRRFLSLCTIYGRG